jgi:hypothetical protein
MRGKRNVIHKGKTVALHELAKGFKGKYTLGFETKDGINPTAKTPLYKEIFT